MEIDLTDEKNVNSVGLLFLYYALYSHAKITEEDLNYLTNTIKKHACFELISNASDIQTGRYSPIEVCNAKINQIVFYSKFYNDPKCPPGIKLVLFTYLGFLRAYVEDSCPNLLEFRYEYVRKWIDSTAEKINFEKPLLT